MAHLHRWALAFLGSVLGGSSISAAESAPRQPVRLTDRLASLQGPSARQGMLPGGLHCPPRASAPRYPRLRHSSIREQAGPRPAIWMECGSDGDRPKRSDLFVTRTADPIPLSIQGVKRATAPQARTPEVAGGPGNRCGGCANAYESVGRKQLVVQGLCGFCAAPRNSGGDRVPIELPTGGAELLHCREKRGLLSRSPASNSHSW